MAKLLMVNKRGEAVILSWLGDLERLLRRKFKIKKIISLAFVSNNEIRRLNKVYRRQDKVTDVLSFNLGDEKVLGEVLICLDRARRQSQEAGHSLQTELKVLVIHGILHLLGYDHERSQTEERRMQSIEKNIYKNLEKGL